MTFSTVSEFDLTLLDADGNPSDASFIATNVTLPNLEQNIDSTSVAGSPGEYPVPGAITAMEFTCTIRGDKADLRSGILTSYERLCTAQMYQAAKFPDGTYKSKVVTLKGYPNMYPTGGDYTSGEVASRDWGLTCVRMSISVDGVEEFSYSIEPTDVHWRVNGVDLYAAKRTALGG